MTPEQIGQIVGIWIGVGAIIALVIWLIWALIKYRPFSHAVQVAYDFRYFVRQVVLMYSNKPSIFSIKRFHNGLITYWAIITASLFIRHNTLTAEGFVMILLPLLALGGYNVYQSQQDKKISRDAGLVNKAIDNATDVANKMADKQD